MDITHGSPRRTLILWGLLVFATLLTWRLGEQHGGLVLTLALLLIATVKGCLVALDFMALRSAPLLWRGLVLGWLVLVSLLIGFAYWKGITP